MRTLHLVSHTHWDREWYLPFQEFRLKLVHLIDDLLDLLAADPDFRHFMLDGQTIVLDDYLEMRPERQADLRREVQAGRVLIGPWHVLPDEFLVSPEATVRNLLEGARTARLFGPRMPVGYIPDPFGHIGQMPQILRGFGIETACLQRGLSDEPCEFWWQAPDGSRVLMAYLRDGYGNAAGLPVSQPETFTAEVQRLRDSLTPYTAAPDVLLMLGTDHMEPSPGTSAAMAYAAGRLGGDRLVHSTLPAFLAAVKASTDLKALPIVAGELRSPKRHPLLANVLSARMWIKQRNQACETLLEKWVEPFCAFAELAAATGRTPEAIARPASLVRQAWRLLMENHPHDSICGCSIDQVHDEMRPRFDQVAQIGEELTRQSLATLAQAVDTRPAVNDVHSALVVFNPAAGPRSDAVAATFELPVDSGDFELLDENGARVPADALGLGSSELVHRTMGRNEFRTALNMVSEGRVAGMALRDLKTWRAGSQYFIEVVLSEKGETNQEAWRRGMAAIHAVLEDPGLTTYAVRARSASATQVRFTAAEVPGHGYRTYWVRARPAEVRAPVRLNPLIGAVMPLAARLAESPWAERLLARLRPDPAARPPFRIENEFFVVEAARDGTLRLNDKRNGATYRGLNRFVDGGDCGDEYNYAPPASDRLFTPQVKQMRVTRGAVRQTLEIRLALVAPAALRPDRKARAARRVDNAIVTRISLTPGVPRVEVETTVENGARDHRLRVHFPAPFGASTADCGGHFEVVRRSTAVPAFDGSWIEQPRPEMPQRAFTDVSDGKQGLMIANRGLPEVEVCRGADGNAEIALTLLRCVGWLSRDDISTRRGHAGPFHETPGAQMPGCWRFEYAIVPHAGGWEAAFESAAAFEAPLRAASTGLHDGPLARCQAFVAVQPPLFDVSAIKMSEDGRGWVVRGCNLSRADLHVTLKPWRPFSRIESVNLAEEHLADLAPLPDGSVSFFARGQEICTALFCL